VECSHRSRWQTLRSANLIHVDMDPKVEAAESREYLALLVNT
jgi:hypothetical protein